MDVHPATINHPLTLSALPPPRAEPGAENLDPVGLWAFESRHSESFAMGFTRHRFVKLLLITQGSGTVHGDWGDRVCKMGDLVVVPAGLRHRIIDDPRHPIALYGLGIAAKLLRCVPGVTAALPSGVLRAEQLARCGWSSGCGGCSMRIARRIRCTAWLRSPPRWIWWRKSY